MDMIQTKVEPTEQYSIDLSYDNKTFVTIYKCYGVEEISKVYSLLSLFIKSSTPQIFKAVVRLTDYLKDDNDPTDDLFEPLYKFNNVDLEAVRNALTLFTYRGTIKIKEIDVYIEDMVVRHYTISEPFDEDVVNLYNFLIR